MKIGVDKDDKEKYKCKACGNEYTLQVNKELLTYDVIFLDVTRYLDLMI